MNRTETEDQLRQVGAARETWRLAHRDFYIHLDHIMRRLIHEAAANRMSAEQMADLSGVSVKSIRELMRAYDLNPKAGKQLLSRKAAEALANNAELLGIEPREMDLMSPLAYLPAGSELRAQLADAQTARMDTDAFLETEQLADAIYAGFPWEGETYQAVAENVAADLIKRGWTRG